MYKKYYWFVQLMYILELKVTLPTIHTVISGFFKMSHFTQKVKHVNIYQLCGKKRNEKLGTCSQLFSNEEV